MTDTTAKIAKIAASTTEHTPAPPAPRIQAPTTAVSENGLVHAIHVSKIKIVSNVRITPLDKTALEALAATIRAHGQLEPAQVRLLDDGAYALTFGHRRHAAVAFNHVKHGGDGLLRCVVRSDIPVEDIPFVQLVENFQREDMTPYDTSVAMAELQAKTGMTAKVMAARIGLSDRQVRTYVIVGQAPEWLRAAVKGVELKVKAKNEDGTPRCNADGTFVTEKATLPGLSLDMTSDLATHFVKLTDSERKYLNTPGYKPVAEKAVRGLIQRAAAHRWTRTQLSERIKKQTLSSAGTPADAEPTVAREPRQPFRLTEKAIQIDLTKLGAMAAEERRALAAGLHAALVAVDPDFFSDVELKTA